MIDRWFLLMQITFFVGFEFVLLILIAIYGVSITIIDVLSSSIFIIISALLIIITLVSTIINTCIQKEEHKLTFSFFASLATTVLYLPYFLFMLESNFVDKSNYLMKFIKTDDMDKKMVYLLIFCLVMIIVPQLISCFTNSFFNKVFNVLPILIGAIMVLYVWNTVGDSYNNYSVKEYKNYDMVVTTVTENADIYIESCGAPLTIYPFFAPKRFINGTVNVGSKVKVVKTRDDLYEDYVFILYNDKAGYIKRDLLKDKIEWRGY